MKFNETFNEFMSLYVEGYDPKDKAYNRTPEQQAEIDKKKAQFKKNSEKLAKEEPVPTIGTTGNASPAPRKQAEDNETVKKAIKGTAKLAGKSALAFADYMTDGDVSKGIDFVKSAYSDEEQEDAEIEDYSEEEISQFTDIDHDLEEGMSVSEVIKIHGRDVVMKYIEYMSEGEEHEDCETCGCEDGKPYGHFNDTYSDYIDEYEAEDGERVDKDRMK